MSNVLLNSENIFRCWLVKMWFISHPHDMSRSSGYVWPLFWITGTIWSAPSTCKTQLLCAKYDPHHQPSQPSAFHEKWNTGPLTVAQAAYEAPAPGVTLFEDFIRSREAHRTHNGAQHVSKTLHSLGQAEAGQETNWATHWRVGPLHVWRIPGLASTSFGHRSRAKWRLFTCFGPKRTVGHVGGGRIKPD